MEIKAYWSQMYCKPVFYFKMEESSDSLLLTYYQAIGIYFQQNLLLILWNLFLAEPILKIGSIIFLVQDLLFVSVNFKRPGTSTIFSQILLLCLQIVHAFGKFSSRIFVHPLTLL